MSEFPIAPHIQAILDKLDPDDREAMLEQLRESYNNARRHAFASILARNFSHGIGSAIVQDAQ